jgi:Ca-activated chloride channel homolog
MRTLLRLWTLSAALAALPASGLAAQGIIVPDRCRDCTTPWVPEHGRAGLPVESITFETTIEGQVATTHVTQVFRNETRQVLEGVYFFPLPEQASISEFAIWDGERRLEGEVRPRDEARRIYEDIVRRVRDPGLLEYAGHDLFQARIFPIPARGTKKLELTYTQVLRAENGTVGFRYPLGVGRNAAPIERLSGRVSLRSDGGLRTIYSPSHDVDVRREGDRRATVSFEQDARRERRDFQLFYALSQADVGMSLFTYREPGKDGYFLLLLSPDDDAARREYPAKDVVFVLDVSGSMAEEGKMEKARRALTFGVRGLNPSDRFNVIAFSGETRLMESGLIAADEAGRRRGVQFVEALDARGGTNINDALVEAMAQFPRQGTRPRLLVFLTDGLPTVGEQNVERIVENVARARREGLRLFTFGVGYDVNTRLLDRVAAENGGTADYVAPQEDLEVRVSSFFDKVNHPVLTNLRLDLGAVRTDLVYPRTLPDLFKGTQLALVGRYRNDRELRDVTLRLTGNASPTHTYTYPGVRFPLRDERHDFVPRLWATRRVGWLMEQIRSHGENRELVQEVTDLGTRFGIVTPYTSFLALEPGMAHGVEQDAGGRRPPPPPSPQSGHGHVSAAAAPAAEAYTGAGAVNESRLARERQDALRVEDIAVAGNAAQESVRRVGARTFYQRSGVWTDAEISDSTRVPETEVDFGSEEYYALIRRIPALAAYFAQGEEVDVIHEGRRYRVRARRG